MERKIIFLDGKEEIIDDTKPFERGTRASVYHYKENKCLKLSLPSINGEIDYVLKNGNLEVLKRIRDLDHPYIYKINDFFKTEYYDSRVLNGGYTMKYYPHYQNDINSKGEECFNALRVPSDRLEVYFNQVFEAVMYLTKNNFEIHDLHRKNIAKGKDCFTIIDCDEYYYDRTKSINYLQHNIQELGYCFAELLSKGLHYSFGVGTENEIRDNSIRSIYLKYVRDKLINYDEFTINNMYDFLKILKEYNTPEEYFEDEFKLVKRIR